LIRTSWTFHAGIRSITLCGQVSALRIMVVVYIILPFSTNTVGFQSWLLVPRAESGGIASVTDFITGGHLEAAGTVKLI
jgi:hypothetical protein